MHSSIGPENGRHVVPKLGDTSRTTPRNLRQRGPDVTNVGPGQGDVPWATAG